MSAGDGALVAIYLVAAGMHCAYEGFLWYRPVVHHEHVMAVNMLAGVVFLLRAVRLARGGVGALAELAWWLYFVLVESIVWTSVSTLEMLECTFGPLPVPCSAILVAMGLTGAALAARRCLRVSRARRTWRPAVAGRRMWLLASVNFAAALSLMLSALRLVPMQFHHRDFDVVCTWLAVFFCVESAAVLLGREAKRREVFGVQTAWWISSVIVLVAFGRLSPLLSGGSSAAGSVQIGVAALGALVSARELAAFARRAPERAPSPSS